MSMEPDEIFEFDVAGEPFTLETLAVILGILNDRGEATIKGVLPGSVNMLVLGAQLEAISRTSIPTLGQRGQA